MLWKITKNEKEKINNLYLLKYGQDYFDSNNKNIRGYKIDNINNKEKNIKSSKLKYYTFMRDDYDFRKQIVIFNNDLYYKKNKKIYEFKKSLGLPNI